MYVGITGRLVIFSQKNIAYYWYGDPINWDISYNFVFKNNDIPDYLYLNCQFILLDDYTVFKLDEARRSDIYINNYIIIYKTLLEKPIEKVEDILLSYTGDQTTFLKMLNNYKTNYLISFDKKINYLSNKIWIHIFLNQIDDKEYL